jgi:hypothetical protein
MLTKWPETNKPHHKQPQRKAHESPDCLTEIIPSATNPALNSLTTVTHPTPSNPIQPIHNPSTTYPLSLTWRNTPGIHGSLRSECPSRRVVDESTRPLRLQNGKKKIVAYLNFFFCPSTTATTPQPPHHTIKSPARTGEAINTQAPLVLHSPDSKDPKGKSRREFDFRSVMDVQCPDRNPQSLPPGPPGNPHCAGPQ